MLTPLAVPTVCTETVEFVQSLPPLPEELVRSSTSVSQLPMLLGAEITTVGTTASAAALIVTLAAVEALGQAAVVVELQVCVC